MHGPAHSTRALGTTSAQVGEARCRVADDGRDGSRCPDDARRVGRVSCPHSELRNFLTADDRTQWSESCPLSTDVADGLPRRSALVDGDRPRRSP